jgi:hypothetical protein
MLKPNFCIKAGLSIRGFRNSLERNHREYRGKPVLVILNRAQLLVQVKLKLIQR